MSTVPPLPPSVAAKLERLARTELSLGARIAHVLLALVSSAMTIVILSLWLTEPGLPARTQAAFAMLTGIGVGWTVFAVWVLRTRRVMLARQNVIAGRLAVAFCGVFAGGCSLMALTGATPAARPAVAMSLAFLAAALVIWRRAESAHATLLARRDALERELSRGRQ